MIAAYRRFLLLLAASLIGCQTLPQPTDDTGSVDVDSEAQADEQYDQALDQDSAPLFSKAVTGYESLLQASPSSASLQYKAYSAYYHLIRLGKWQHHERAQHLYGLLPRTVRVDLAPPSLAKLAYLYQLKKGNFILRESLILAALNEEPRHIGAHIELARLRRSQGDLIGPIAMIKQAVHLRPDDSDAQLELGFAYSDRVLSGTCAYQVRDSIPKAIKLLQQQRERASKPYFLSAELSQLYGLLGLMPLQLREARRAYQEQGTPYTQYRLAASLLESGHLDEATPHYQALIAQGETNLAMDLVSARARQGQWQQAKAEADSYLQYAQPSTFYQALTIELIEAKLAIDPGYSYRDLTQAIDFSPWQRSLDFYWRDILPERALLERATDVCKVAEAEYYIGLKQWLANRKHRAQQHFQKVIASKTFGFKEFAYAKQLLRELKNED